MQEFLKEYNVKLDGEVVRQGRKYFLVNKELQEAVKIVPRQPEYIGIFLGEKKKSFKPSIELIDIASKQSKNISVINDKAEWMFLCGKDVFEENVKGKMQGTVFVNNEHNENLGIGYWTRKKGRKIIKNTLDKGMYLRKYN